MRAIIEIQAIGYRIDLMGDEIRLVWDGEEDPEPQRIRPLLEEIKVRKGEALEYLKRTSSTTPKIKQSIIDLVAADFKDGRYLSDQEFTDRYMVLMRAYRDGVIDEQMRDEGLEFLLDYWDYAKQNRPQ